jgi:hypothetical protein
MSAARHRKFPDRPARSLMRWSMVFRGRAAALRRHPSLRSKDLHCESIAIAFASRTAPSRFLQAAGSRSTRRVRGRLQAAATSMIRLPKSLPISCGLSQVSKALASGELRRQIGRKLQATDSCNLIYVMWHIEPDTRVTVSIKQNPALHAHDQCGVRDTSIQVAERRLPHPSRRGAQDAR